MIHPFIINYPFNIYSMALDFDEYNNDWQNTAVSMPSDSVAYNKSKQKVLDIGYY
jgi:hypothetical protein